MELDQSLTFDNVYASDRSLFSLMAMTGYLNAVPAGGDIYDISIPNAEVMKVVKKMAERFGFTDPEVRKALEGFGCADRFDTVREWYGGHRFGRAELYDPSGVTGFIGRGCEAEAYRAGGEGDVLIRDLLKGITAEKRAEITDLVAGGTVRTSLREWLPYESVRESGKALYSLMVMSGYLNAVETGEEDIFGDTLYELSVPNEETKAIVRRLMGEVHPKKPSWTWMQRRLHDVSKLSDDRRSESLASDIEEPPRDDENHEVSIR